MKKIALLIPSLNYGGAERVVSLLSKIFNEKFNVYIIIYNKKNIFYKFKGNIIELNFNDRFRNHPLINKVYKILSIPIIIQRLKNIKKNNKFDYVISFLNHFNILNLITRDKEKVIISVRNYIKSKHSGVEGLIYKYLIKKHYKKANYIVAASKLIAHELNLDFSIEKKKIKVIYNPYDIKKIIQLSEKKIKNIYYENFITKKTLITIGSYTDKKNHYSLLKIIKKLKEIDSSFKLIIIGEGIKRKSYEKYIKKNKLENFVLLTGFLENPFSLLKRSSLFLLSSFHEGFPNVLIEAMICKKAIVSTDCFSGPSEILMPTKDWRRSTKEPLMNKYGYLTPAILKNNLESFTPQEMHFFKSILNVFEKKDLKPYFEKNVSERADEFSLNSISKKWFEIIYSKSEENK